MSTRLNLNSPVIQTKAGIEKKRVSGNISAKLVDKFKKYVSDNGYIQNHVLENLVKDYLISKGVKV
jgi:hypothetical protein